ncbi:Uncharacterised protein [Elizabethkingia anophelis]|nr:Uncharacterised protein [Elizabethkingia anophelis]
MKPNEVNMKASKNRLLSTLQVARKKLPIAIIISKAFILGVFEVISKVILHEPMVIWFVALIFRFF